MGLALILVAGILTSLVFWIAMESVTQGGLAPPVDDSFIYFQYSRMIASGYPFSYAPGAPPTTGATSFLYPFLLAPGFLIGLNGSSIIVYAYVLNALFLIAAAVLVYFLARRLTNRYLATLAALLVVIPGPIPWGFFSLLEIGLLAVVLLLVAYLFVQELQQTLPQQTLPWKTLIAASLLPLCRPEGVLMVAFVVVLVLVRLAPLLLERAWLRPRGRRVAVNESQGIEGFHSRYGAPLSTTLALFLPLAVSAGYLLLLRALTGSFSTNTFLTKAIHAAPMVTWFDKLGLIAGNTATLLQDPFGLQPTYLPILLFLFLMLGLARHIGMEVHHKRPGIGFLGLGLFLILVGSASQLPSFSVHHYRYIMAIFPLVLVFVVIGLKELSRLQRRENILALGLGTLLLLLIAINSPKWVQRYAENTGDIYFQQVSLGHWLRDNIPHGSIIALNDAGAISYYSQHPVYDLLGLVTDGASLPFRHGTGAVFEHLRSLPVNERPEYFAIYPGWFAFPEGVFLTEIFRTQLLQVTIAGGPSVVVYRADYSTAEHSNKPALDHTERDRWELVDSLNVADLADEADHEYRQVDWIPRGNKGVTVLREWNYAANNQHRVLDGGRIILGAEEFTVNTQQERPLKVVMRTDAFFPVTLQVYANDEYAGEWSYHRQGNAWVEPSFILPGTLVQGSLTRLRLELKGNALTGHDYVPFYYWFYQSVD
jgi:hypothetical protein